MDTISEVVQANLTTGALWRPFFLYAAMAAVAIGRCRCVLATTQRDCRTLFQDEFMRRDVSAGMRAVTERLLFRSATGTPIVGARIEIEHVREFLGYHRLGHDILQSPLFVMGAG